jgi:hypothetical protein
MLWARVVENTNLIVGMKLKDRFDVLNLLLP